MTFFETILLIISAQGIFLSVILLTSRKGNKGSNLLLSGFVAVASFYLLYLWLYKTFYIQYVAHLTLTSFLVVPLLPSLFYLYFKSINRQEIKRKWVHFLPFALQFIFYIPFLLENTRYKAQIVMKEAYSPIYNTTSTKIFTVMHIGLFLFYAWKILQTRTVNNSDNSRNSWNKGSQALFTSLAISYSLGVGLGPFFSINFPDYLFVALIAITVYGIGYYGYTKQELVFDITPVSNEKYRNSRLSKSESETQFEKVYSFILKERSFLNFNLKLEDLAQQLSLPPHTVSQVINQNTGKNFSEFLNEFRVEEAKNLLQNGEDTKMLAIAYDSGFGNKVSFYKNFRKYTGMSPMEYRVKKTEQRPLKHV